mmetsp:Transcript_46150/g.107315  ORF Transcript_46150/g.107315 Transcript_46150/m.107315 type:complete len:208 (+) Transcript_46150:734-1357(+)
MSSASSSLSALLPRKASRSKSSSSSPTSSTASAPKFDACSIQVWSAAQWKTEPPCASTAPSQTGMKFNDFGAFTEALLVAAKAALLADSGTDLHASRWFNTWALKDSPKVLLIRLACSAIPVASTCSNAATSRRANVRSAMSAPLSFDSQDSAASVSRATCSNNLGASCSGGTGDDVGCITAYKSRATRRANTRSAKSRLALSLRVS